MLFAEELSSWRVATLGSSLSSHAFAVCHSAVHMMVTGIPLAGCSAAVVPSPFSLWLKLVNPMCNF